MLLSLSRAFTGIRLVSVVVSLLEGFLKIATEGGAGLAALKACEILSRLILACSGAIR